MDSWTYRYLPVLKTKAGEITALENLSVAAKARVFPLLRMTSDVSPTVTGALVSKLASVPISLDGEHNAFTSSSTSSFISLFNHLGSSGVSVIPAISTNADTAYIQAALRLVGKYCSGSVIITTLGDLGGVINWCSANSLRSNEVDLVITAGDAAPFDPNSFARYVYHSIISVLSNGPAWRSVSLHSYSAAKDHGVYNKGRTLVPRRCWGLWNNICSQSLPFKIDYSDCGHVHPSLDEVPGYAMINATVSVRYTINDCWVVIKGSSTRGPAGIAMSDQYKSHAKALLAEHEFNSLSQCWGDDRIRIYAASQGGAGGRKEWVGVLLNRHLSHVCDRLP
jgi:hypothetical protein